MVWLREGLWLGMLLSAVLLAWLVGDDVLDLPRFVRREQQPPVQFVSALAFTGVALGLAQAMGVRLVWAVRRWLPAPLAPVAFAGLGAISGAIAAHQWVHWWRIWYDRYWSPPCGSGFDWQPSPSDPGLWASLTIALVVSSALYLPIFAVLHGGAGHYTTRRTARWATLAVVLVVLTVAWAVADVVVGPSPRWGMP